MPWYDALVGEPFLNWLRAAANERHAPQVKGDPFATSMRDFDDVSEDLDGIAKGIRSGKKNRMTDLRAAKLIIQDGETLSDLGMAVRDGWISFKIADSAYKHELPRYLVLVCEALIRGEQFYLGLASFWRKEKARYGVDLLIERWTDSFVQTYFSKALGDYNPIANVGPLENLPEWNAEQIRTKVSSMVTSEDKALVGLEKIISALNEALSRGKARKIFIAALCLAQEPSQNFAQEKLANWTFPLASGAGHVQLPQEVRDICLSILKHYEVRLREVEKTVQEPANLELLLKRKNVILFGPPGTGKTFGAHQIEDYWKGAHGPSSVISITFHPTYSYEDFVWGWRPANDDSTKFVGQNGALLEACEIARDGTPTLLLIDEINRADTARVFGELITYIESDKRERPFRIAQDSKNDRTIPSNLYILGTMNTADRSVSLLDIALRRRFAFVEYAPDPTIFARNNKWVDFVNDVPIDALMMALNARLSEAGVESDRAIGHALLSVSSTSPSALSELRDRIQYDIYPLVVDYCFSDRSRVSQVLGELVSADGRLQTLDDERFLAALRSISG